MKFTKNTIKLTSFALLLFFIGSVGAGVAKAADTPEQAAKIFYQWYLKEISREGGDPLSKKQTIAKYVTKRLLKEINARISSADIRALIHPAKVPSAL